MANGQWLTAKDMEEKDIQEELLNEEEIVASEPGKYDALMAEQSTKRLTGIIPFALVFIYFVHSS